MKPSSLSNFQLWAKLHPPLPRTPRESEQLLNALTSSFRRELDREHPPTASSSDQSPTPDNVNAERMAEKYPHSSAYAADKHLHAILDNPLFRVAPAKPTVLPRPSQKTKSPEWSKEPMVVFDELVASGSATAAAVIDCLGRQMVLASTETGERFNKALRDSRAGSRTVSWWLSSSPKRREAFLLHPISMHHLCKFMVAEELHGTIFNWLKMLADCNLGKPDGRISKSHATDYFTRLLSAFLKAEFDCGGDLVSSLRYYMAAYRMLISTEDGQSKLPLEVVLRLPAGRLCKFLSLRARGKSKTSTEVPADLFEEFQSTLSELLVAKIIVVRLPIYHPTRPDAKPFVQYVRSLRPGEFDSWSEKKRNFFTRSGFDALRVLVDAEEFDDCLFLAHFLKQHEAATVAKTDLRVSSEEKEQLTNLDLAF
ncbi:hypothetical protein BDV12DRAFT_138752 [Aspergillus spectabilis]